MTYMTFKDKWKDIYQKDSHSDENSLFVDVGHEPVTQRQLNLYYYFLFIKDILLRSGAQKVLEVGCGRGTISLYLAKYLCMDVHLLDSSEDGIEIARALFNQYNQPAHFYIGDALATALPSGSFDAVISIGLAEHFDAVDGLFAEQYRLLKPGGVMISLNIPKKISIQFLNTIMRVGKKMMGSYRASVKKDYYRNSLTPKEYERVARQVGFVDTRIMPVSPFPLFTPVDMNTDKKITALYKKILSLRKLFMPYPYKVNQILSGGHFLVGYKK